MAIDNSKHWQLRRESGDIFMSPSTSIISLLQTRLRGSSGIRTDDVTLQKSVVPDWFSLARENSKSSESFIRVLIQLYC